MRVGKQVTWLKGVGQLPDSGWDAPDEGASQLPPQAGAIRSFCSGFQQSWAARCFSCLHKARPWLVGLMKLSCGRRACASGYEWALTLPPPQLAFPSLHLTCFTEIPGWLEGLMQLLRIVRDSKYKSNLIKCVYLIITVTSGWGMEVHYPSVFIYQIRNKMKNRILWSTIGWRVEQKVTWYLYENPECMVASPQHCWSLVDRSHVCPD